MAGIIRSTGGMSISVFKPVGKGNTDYERGWQTGRERRISILEHIAGEY